jgi:hypothetical protein
MRMISDDSLFTTLQVFSSHSVGTLTRVVQPGSPSA